MGRVTCLFFNPISENDFYDFGITHSTSWRFSFHSVTAEVLAFTSSERWPDFGIMGNSNGVSSCLHLFLLTIFLFLFKMVIFCEVLQVYAT